MDLHAGLGGPVGVRAVVFGGYGVFGSIVSGELARLGLEVTVAGRDVRRARGLAERLGPPHRALHADLADAGSRRRALAAGGVAVNCAGPFQPAATRALLEDCLEAGCHYADIADDRASIGVVRGHGARFSARGLGAAYGCSSLPGLSVALAVAARARGPSAPPARGRMSLFIGNDNPKGGGSIASMVSQLGRPIAAPQGRRRAFRGCVRVPLPPPLGERTACDFDGAEHDLLPQLLGLGHVEVKVGFEMGLATRALSWMAAAGPVWGLRAARALEVVGRWAPRAGSSAGAVMAELWWPDGHRTAAALVARAQGQRMAALPCAWAARKLAEGPPTAGGARLPHELLGLEDLLAGLRAEGFAVEITPAGA